MRNKALKITIATAFLAAIASVLLIYLRTPIPFMPPFMDFDLAGVPELLGTFVLGPISGCFIALIKILVKLAMQGTMSVGTGEFCNIALSITYVMSTWVIWFVLRNKLSGKDDLNMQGGESHRKTEQIKTDTKAAVIACIFGVIITTIMACVLNVFVILPFYSNAYGMDIEAIIGMMAATNPYIKNLWTAVIMGIAPFNIIKYGINSLIICLIYSRLVPALKRMIS